MTTTAGHRSERCLGFTATSDLDGRNSFWAPNGDYSRRYWLPVLGPTSWLLWGSLTDRLNDAHGSVSVAVNILTVEHGLGRPERLLKALERLEHFGLTRRTGSDNWTILPVTPSAPSTPSTTHTTRPVIDRECEARVGVDGFVVDSLRIVTPPADHPTRELGA